MENFLSWTSHKSMAVQLREKLEKQYREQLSCIQSLHSASEKEESLKKLEEWYRSDLEKWKDSLKIDYCPTDLQTNYIAMLAKIDCTTTLEDADKLDMMLAYGVMVQRNFHCYLQESEGNLVLAAVGAKLSYEDCVKYAHFLGDPVTVRYITAEAPTLDQQVSVALSLVKRDPKDSIHDFGTLSHSSFHVITDPPSESPKRMIK